MMATGLEEVRERIEEAARRTRGRAPQLKTIAKFINETSDEYRAEVEAANYLTRHSYAGSLRKHYRESDRTANVLLVYRRNAKGHSNPVYRYDPTETAPYTNNTDVCRWVVNNVIGG